VVTPQRQFSGDSLKRLVAQPGVTHLTWRGFHGGSLHGRRVLYAWPDRQHLNDLWGSGADALVVIEWNEVETTEWIDDAKPRNSWTDTRFRRLPPTTQPKRQIHFRTAWTGSSSTSLAWQRATRPA